MATEENVWENTVIELNKKSRQILYEFKFCVKKSGQGGYAGIEQMLKKISFVGTFLLKDSIFSGLVRNLNLVSLWETWDLFDRFPPTHGCK